MSAQPQIRESSGFETAARPQSPVRMRVKQRASDDDRGTITVLTNDPFQSLIPPSGERRASARALNVTPPATLAYRWAALPKSEVKVNPRGAEVFTQPPPSLRIPLAPEPTPRIVPDFTPKAFTKKVPSTARDAWCAVALMGMFIVGGIAWTSNRILSDDSMISELRVQLDEANATIQKKLDQIKQLYARVTDAENEAAKARTMSTRAKQR